MTATLDAPLASEVILIRLPGIPEARPRWVEFVDVDDIEADGTGAIFWHRVVETSGGDLMVSQWLWISPEGVTVTRAFWDSRGYEFELTGRECVAMADALRRVARYVEQADRDALTLAGDMGDPWITTTEAAKRLGTTGRELQDLIAAGVTAVKIASVTYVRAADLPGVAR